MRRPGRPGRPGQPGQPRRPTRPTRPSQPSRQTRNRAFLAAGLLVALLLAGVVSFYASAAPDGLEKVTADKGIQAPARDHAVSGSPFTDYVTKGVEDGRLSGGLAGAAGVLVTLGAGGALFFALRRRGDGRG
jgi:cobalt/nickel transport system permease protein